MEWTAEELTDALETCLDCVIHAQEIKDEMDSAECSVDESDYANLMEEQMETLGSVRNVRTFEQAMLMTRDAGLVIRMKDGSEFQLTIVQSKRAND